MHVLIDNRYKLVNSNLERIVINNYTLLYKWPGTNPSSKTIVFMAHQDVVPAEQPNRWTHSPFAGVIDNDTFMVEVHLIKKMQYLVLLKQLNTY